MRPWLSVFGTRWTRWTPDSNFRLRRRNVHRLDLPALMLGETQIHLVQIAREDRRLIAASGSADLDDDVLLVGGVARDEHELDVFLETGQLLFDRRDFLLGEFLHVWIGEHFFGFGQIVEARHVFAGLGDERALIRIALRELVVLVLVGQNLRIAELRLEILVCCDDLLKLFAHAFLFYLSHRSAQGASLREANHASESFIAIHLIMKQDI